jgi:hypothetical protein
MEGILVLAGFWPAQDRQDGLPVKSPLAAPTLTRR